MDKMDLVSALLVSVPEQLLLIITILLMVARVDLIKLNKTNIARISIATLINTTFSVFIRYVSTFFVLNIALQIIVFSLIYIFFLKIKWHETIVATMLALAEFFVLEFVICAVLIIIPGVGTQNVLNSDFLRILISLPVRLAEGGVAFLIFKTPVVIIDLKPLKLTTGFFKRFSLLSICLFFGVMEIANSMKLIFFDLEMAKSPEMMTFLFTTIIFVLILFCTIYITINKIQKNHEWKNNNYIQTLLYINHLLGKGNGGIGEIKEIVEDEINRAGVKKYD